MAEAAEIGLFSILHLGPSLGEEDPLPLGQRIGAIAMPARIPQLIHA